MAKALYLHIPFCARKCAYCDFASAATRADNPLVGAYVRALAAQLSEVADLGLLEDCETAYVGGGTPSLLGAEKLGGLVSAARAAAPGVDELTCEANPDSLTDEVLGAVREAGATRLSIGVQSLDDAELAELGRLHDAACARERVAAAVACGLDVSCDLMCATPRQTDASWARTLEGALSLGVGHVSVYPLQIEEGTAFGRRWGDAEPAFNDPDVQAARMKQAQVMLEGRGFERYEVASYARPGQRCRHNIAYWTGAPYLGLGTKASSMLNLEQYLRLRASAPQLLEPPESAVRARLTVETGPRALTADPRLSALSLSLEFLTASQAAAEDLMLGARLTDGPAPALVSRARALLGPSIDDTLADLVARGLLAERGDRLAPTARGWLLGNELYGALWALAPGEVVEARC
ncbi:coproporphyrinogen-III oxidase family protein [Thermophilibacter sp.]